MNKRLLVIVALLFTVQGAHAAVECTGKIKKLLIYRDGWVNVSADWRGDYTMICNLKDEWKGVSVTTCAMWASMLQNLKKSDKSVSFYYGADDNVSSCDSIPTYKNSPAPVYIGDIF